MLGFDSYSKSIIGSIVEQRIRLFLTKRKIINIPVFKTVSKSDTATIVPIGDKLFEFFKGETADLFYYYAFSSILLNTPDYNFLINDDAESLKKAEDNLRAMFDKILQDFFEGKAPDENNQGEQVDNSNLFNFIKDPKYQRDLPPFKTRLKGTQLDVQNVKDVNLPLFADVLSKIFEKDSKQKLIYEMPQPFYVDFFYRYKGEDQQLLKYKPLLKYVSYGDGIGDPSNPASAFDVANTDLFNRGARLMFNLTSGITQPTGSTDSYKGINYYPLQPSKFLPFFSAQTDNTSPSKFVKDYPLPFLSTNVRKITGKSSVPVPETTNSPTPSESSVYGPTFLYGVVRKIQNGNGGKTGVPLKKESVHWITDTKYVNNGESLDKHYFYALKNAVDATKIEDKLNYPEFKNWNELMWSKSLVCFDYLPPTDKDATSKMYAYFPMIIAEYVSESGEDDETIISKLLETKEVKLFNDLINTDKISEQPTSLVSIVETNEKNNIKKLFEIAEIKNEPGEKIDPIKTQEEKLDNMLLKLINFDEET